VIGLERQAAISALHNAGFTVAMVLAPSDQQAGTVIAQDPGGGSRLIQTGTVTITVAKGPEPSPEPELVTVPKVVGLQQEAAEAALQQAGFVAAVSFAQECDPEEPSCDYRPGVVWSQSPNAGARRERGSTVTIYVNP